MTERMKKAVERIQMLVTSEVPQEEALRRVIEVIHSAREVYDWVGIYVFNEKEGILELFPFYIGRPTPHTRIPLDQGICGAAVRENQTIVVDDVNQDPRYLACSIHTRSEIVVPIRTPDGRVVAEIDIDSDTLAAFTEEDREFLEAVARVLGAAWERWEEKAGDAGV